MTAFPQLLSRLLASDAGRPLVTFYDDASGERTELSVTTWANWVAKVASLLAEELDVGHGARLLVDLPAHWLSTVVLGAAWSSGVEVLWADGPSGAAGADAVVTGPAGLERWAPEASRVPVVASALLPLAGPFADGVPAGVHDLGVEVWSQPDSYTAWPTPTDDDPAVPGLTHSELWAAGTAVSGRLLSQANPASTAGLACLTGPLAGGGSLVLVVNASPGRVEQLALAERVTDRFAVPH